MKKNQMVILLMATFFLVFASLAVQCTKVQTNQQDTRVREMAVTGEIAQGRHNYIIRGKVPSMILTILNPDPKILDEYVKTAKNVDIDVRIVSGDNIEIMTIEGKEYSQKIE
jgi:hypothetical protein